MKILPYKNTQEGVEALERTLQALSPFVHIKKDENGVYSIDSEGYVVMDPAYRHIEEYLAFAIRNQGYARDVTG
jgi:hypothetical protein